MKKLNIFYAIGVAVAMTSCADYIDTNNFYVAEPEGYGDTKYLDEYEPLKNYIDRSAHPNFKLGAALTAADYSKGGTLALLANSNFDMLTAGNAMKYASCVNEKGQMDFSTVEAFVDAAKAGGVDIYGHTLAWHAQQNTKYLNGLIADKDDPNYNPGELVEVTKTEKATCVEIHASEMVENPWDNQWFLYFPDVAFSEGDSWEFSMRTRAAKDASIGTQVHTNPGGYIHWAAVGNVTFKTEWFDYTSNGTISSEQNGGNCIAFNLNDFADENTYWMDNISFKLNGVELVVNGNCDDPNGNSQFVSRNYGNADYNSTIVSEITYTTMEAPSGLVETTEKVNCLEIVASEMAENPWDNQLFIYFPNATFAEGDKWEFKADIRALNEASVGSQTHTTPGAYIHWQGCGTFAFKTEWTTMETSGSMTSEQNGGSCFALNLNDFADANTYWLDNVSFKLNGTELIVNGNFESPEISDNFVSKEYGNGELVPSRIVDHITVMGEASNGKIPLTPEEKKEVLSKAMEEWIAGMMKATDGYVYAWDLVNEAIAGGGDNGAGFYPLQSGNGEAGNDFFWQDYLGSVDYVRIAEKYARQYFQGNPSDLKLFINDYNLESDWDNNKKLKSLIHWIGKWESDGVCKIDGIGTQMHISYYLNPEVQKSKEQHIVEMFKLMAASGKPCRITELDMGIVDENGNSISTADVTMAQQKAMGDYYKFIIQKYYEIIPVEQQFGICQWCLTDSPAGSGWRPNEPVGLWDLNYKRKHQYAGFADGLAGK